MLRRVEENALGRAVTFFRQRKRLTLRHVGEMMGLHVSTLSGYERGVRRPSPEILKKLADVYEIPLAYLVLDERDLQQVIPEEVAEAVLLFMRRPDIKRLVEEVKNFPQLAVE